MGHLHPRVGPSARQHAHLHRCGPRTRRRAGPADDRGPAGRTRRPGRAAGVGHGGRLRLRHRARPARGGVRPLPRPAHRRDHGARSGSCSPTPTASPTRPPRRTSCPASSTTTSTWSRPSATRWCSTCRSRPCADPTAGACARSAARSGPTSRRTTGMRHLTHDGPLCVSACPPNDPRVRLLGDSPWPFPSAGCRVRTRDPVGRSGRPLPPRWSPARTAPARPPSRRTSPAPSAAPTTAVRSSHRPDVAHRPMPERGAAGPAPDRGALLASLGVELLGRAAHAGADPPLLRVRERPPADQRAPGVPRRFGAVHRRHRAPLPRPPGAAGGPAGEAALQRRQHARARGRGRHPRRARRARRLPLPRPRRGPSPAGAPSPASSPTPPRR